MAEGGPSKSKPLMNFGNKFGRAVERLKEKVGISEKTTDVEFQHYEGLFKIQEKNAHKLEKVLKHYLNETKQYERVTKEVAEEINKIWEEEWNEKIMIDQWTRQVSSTFENYSTHLEKDTYENYLSYTKEFPVLQKQIKRRETRRVDYARRKKEWDTLDQKATSVKEEKLDKARHELKFAEREFNECHDNLLKKLPKFHDERVEVMSETFKSLASNNIQFFEEMAKLFDNLGDASDRLKSSGTQSSHSFKPFEQKSFEIEKPNGFIEDRPAKQEKKDEKKFKRPGLEQVLQMEIPKASCYAEKSPDYEEAPTGLKKSEENSNVVFAPPSMKLNDEVDIVRKDLDTEPLDKVIPELPKDTEQKEKEQVKDKIKAEKREEKKENAKEKQNEPKNLLYKVKVSHQYEAEDNDELQLNVGDVIFVVPFDDPDEADEGWRMGIVAETGKKGLFPENFTKRC